MKNLSTDYAGLALLPMPAATRTYTPVPHKASVDAVRAAAASRGMTVYDETFGLDRKGHSLFYNAKVAGQELCPGVVRAFGFRTSNNKRFAFKGVGGASVVVCSNGVLRGSFLVARRHTGGMDVGDVAERLMDRLDAEFERVAVNITVLKAAGVDDDRARLRVFAAAERGAIPSGDVLKVWSLWRDPPHEEFRERTEWGLYQAFNQRFKDYSPMSRARSFERLAPLFGLDR